MWVRREWEEKEEAYKVRSSGERPSIISASADQERIGKRSSRTIWDVG
jgi:hypothetical protein